ADYYWLFFDAAQLVRVSAGASARKIHEGSAPASAKRSASLVEFRRKQLLPETIDVEFADDWRIDRLAEFCDLVQRKIWAEFSATRKSGALPDVAPLILEILGLSDLGGGFDRIANLNEAIRKAGEKGNTGGVPLAWYFAAAQFFKRNPGKGPD